MVRVARLLWFDLFDGRAHRVQSVPGDDYVMTPSGAGRRYQASQVHTPTAPQYPLPAAPYFRQTWGNSNPSERQGPEPEIDT